MRTLPKDLMRLPLPLTLALLFSACDKKDAPSSTQNSEPKNTSPNRQPAKSQQMRDTKSRAANSKSDSRNRQRAGVWEQLTNHPPKDYFYHNMPFHEAVTLLLSEVYGPDSAQNGYCISFEGREDLFQFPTSEGETLPKELFHESRWLNEFEIKASSPTKALLQLSKATGCQCRITPSGLLFVAKKNSSDKNLDTTFDIHGALANP